MLKNLDKKKKIILIIIGVILIIGIIKIIDNKYQTNEEYKINTSDTKNNITEEKEISEEVIIVYITGEVKQQGVIKLTAGSRIADAIEKAGGLTENANIKNINLAYELEDGEKIYIPNINEKEITVTDSLDRTESQSEKEKTININKAGTEELKNLNGIGDGLAKNIIQYREENGKFKNIEELMNVPGIGESKFNKIKEYIKIK